MADKNNSEFYRGKRKKTAPALIITAIVLTLIAFVVLVFYGLQKYIVVSNHGLRLDIPFLSGEAQTQVDDGGVHRTFVQADAELEISAPDYSNISAQAGASLKDIKAVYIPASEVTQAGVDARLASKPGNANAVVLDVKTTSGMLVWKSEAELARGYATSGSVDLKPIIDSVKGQGLYVAVRLCCFADDTLASRYSPGVLRTSDGEAFSDSNGAWLDPTNAAVRTYMTELCKELAAMGADEIILVGMRLPDAAGVSYAYSSTSTTAQTPLSAVSGFAINLSRSLRGSGAKLSVQITSQTALSEGVDNVTGQSAELFFKIFDRVYCTSDASSAASAVSGAERYVELGEVGKRLVPICYSSAPDTDCWVITQ